MKKLLVPLVLLALGLGGGVGAGLALAPSEEVLPEGLAAPCGPPLDGERHEATAEGDQGTGAAPDYAEGDEGGHDYVKLPNQFIVPLIEGGDVAGLMLVSLSVEVPAGLKDQVGPIEPKLRDGFLRALFDHANTGGFEGVFTASGAVRGLRAALLAAAREASGGLVTDVLIVEMVRQDR